MPLNAPPPRVTHPSQVPKYVSVKFPFGAYHRADTCEEAEEYVKSVLCAWDTLWDHQHFRDILAGRALVNSFGEIEMDTDGSSRDFLFECERAGFLTFALHYDGEAE